ncbi:MAG: proline/glycine betaine ABC transporter permease [Peptococcaceae bacterium]|nr:proline/glycine betaine ABC transporter permease [Peptococcaceae bacterium]
MPLAQWVETFVDYLSANFSAFFGAIADIILYLYNAVNWLFQTPPSLLIILVFALLAWRLKGWGFALFSALSLWFLDILGLWSHTMSTLSLVIAAVLVAVVIGLPTGIAAARYDMVSKVVRPVLDFMQTLPAFVYLIPAIIFFGLGTVPAIISTIIFGMPPVIRFTELGIRQVPEDVIEAAQAFGSTTNQMLFKVQLPMAMPTVMAGINQTIMLSLSMAVIASMIGAGGLGDDVLRAITQLEVGLGFEGGIGIVILAIILDRLTRAVVKN